MKGTETTVVHMTYRCCPDLQSWSCG